MTYIQNLGAVDEVRERMKVRLGSFINLLRVCERDFTDVCYVFLFIVVGDEDPIGFSWFLCWYLSHIAGIVAINYQCCPILYLWIDFISIDILWWWGWINSRQDHICAPSGQCCWTCDDLEVMTGKLHSMVVI